MREYCHISNFGINALITIYDMDAKLVFKETTTAQIIVNMSHYAKGEYIVCVKDTDRTSTQKILNEK